MKRVFAVVPGLLLLTMTACLIPSMYPLGGEEDYVFDQALVGEWQGEDEYLWNFYENGKGYDLSVTAPNANEAKFRAGIVVLGNHRFLSTLLTDVDIDNDVAVLHLIPVHQFFKLGSEEGELRLIPMDQDWLQEQLNRNALESVLIGEKKEVRVITASTEKLQEFVKSHADHPDAFDEEHKIVLNKK